MRVRVRIPMGFHTFLDPNSYFPESSITIIRCLWLAGLAWTKPHLDRHTFGNSTVRASSQSVFIHNLRNVVSVGFK